MIYAELLQVLVHISYLMAHNLRGGCAVYVCDEHAPFCVIEREENREEKRREEKRRGEKRTVHLHDRQSPLPARAQVRLGNRIERPARKGEQLAFLIVLWLLVLSLSLSRTHTHTHTPTHTNVNC